jgi:phosphatidylserine synthase
MMRAPVHDLHVSNLVSYASLFCGVAAIGAAHADGGRHAAGALLAAAALFDTFDGRFARQFARTPEQAGAGAELDSLVDACVFGVAPIAVLIALAPPAHLTTSVIWSATAFIYLLAVVTRLGFFNRAADDVRFVGVPTPAVALIWSTVLIASPRPALVATVFAVSAAAMVAPLVIPRPRGLALGVFASWAVALIAAHVLS